MITIKISKANGENCEELEKKVQKIIFASLATIDKLIAAYIISGEKFTINDELSKEDFIGTYINISFEE